MRRGPVLLATAAAAIGAALAWFAATQRASVPPAAPALMTLESLAELVSLRLQVADVIEFSQPHTEGIPWTDWQLEVGAVEVVLVARGDCTVATDLKAARHEAEDRAARTLTIVLPEPRPLSARVRHGTPEQGGSRLFAVGARGIDALVPSDPRRRQAIDGAFALAQRKVEAACGTPEVLAAARRSAQEALAATYRAAGWTVTVRWQGGGG